MKKNKKKIKIKIQFKFYILSQKNKNMSKRRLGYLYNNNIGSFYYRDQHPMKPIRIKMAYQVIVNYGLYRQMEVYEPHWANYEELTNFHSSTYINYLESISNNKTNKQLYSVVETDCPAFSVVLSFSSNFSRRFN